MSPSESAKAYPLPSEDMEAFAARIIGAMGMRCEAVKEDETNLHAACVSLWWAARGLDHIAIAARTACDFNDATGLHFSMAMSNERGKIAQYIKAKTGLDPEKHPSFQTSRD